MYKWKQSRTDRKITSFKLLMKFTCFTCLEASVCILYAVCNHIIIWDQWWCAQPWGFNHHHTGDSSSKQMWLWGLGPHKHNRMRIQKQHNHIFDWWSLTLLCPKWWGLLWSFQICLQPWDGMGYFVVGQSPTFRSP